MTHYKRIILTGLAVLLACALVGCAQHAAMVPGSTGPLCYRSATALEAAIRNGEVSSSELLDIYLARIKRYNGKLNAVVALDAKDARARAAKADQARARGEFWGPLHGLPMTVKDVYEVVGMPATSGSLTLKDYRPRQNAIAVQRLIDAGAIVFGKTNTPRFGSDIQTYNKVYGTTNNPWDLKRTPGGSSGGSAVALAVGFTPLELGSDLGGSLRIPPNYTGVYGHRPSFGLVPRYGHIPPLPGTVPPQIMPKLPLFVAGPLARYPDDLALALEVLVAPGKAHGRDARPKLLPAPQKKPGDYKVGVWFSNPCFYSTVDAPVMKALQKAIAKLRAAGLKVEKLDPGYDLDADRRLFMQFYTRMMARLPPEASALQRRKQRQAMWAEVFKRYDVVLAPVNRIGAFTHDTEKPRDQRVITVNGKPFPYMSNVIWCLPAVVAGLPATVAPVGRDDKGMPVGVQIIGPRYGDRATIAFAGAMAGVLGGFTPPPGY